MKLYGASGHAKVVIDILRANVEDVEYLYDDNSLIGSLYGKNVKKPYRVIGPLIITIGNNRLRHKIPDRCSAIYFSKAIHPSAIVSSSAQIGDGTVVMDGAVIEAEAVIGRHNIIKTCASVNQECCIGDFVDISPNATLCGNVSVGEGTWVGAGATVIPGIKIGRWCIIGAGAIVIKDIPDGATAVGNPCKISKTNRMIDNQQLNSGGIIRDSSIIWLHNTHNEYAA